MRVGTKWSTLYRRHFRMHFRHRICILWLKFGRDLVLMDQLTPVGAVNGPLTRSVKLQVAHAPGMPGRYSPAADFKGNRQLAIPACTCHVPWCMSGSLTYGDGENVLGIPGACAPAILRIWQEAHGQQDFKACYGLCNTAGRKRTLNVLVSHYPYRLRDFEKTRKEAEILFQMTECIQRLIICQHAHGALTNWFLVFSPHTHGLVWGCSSSGALAIGLPQSCTKLSK